MGQTPRLRQELRYIFLTHGYRGLLEKSGGFFSISLTKILSFGPLRQ